MTEDTEDVSWRMEGFLVKIIGTKIKLRQPTSFICLNLFCQTTCSMETEEKINILVEYLGEVETYADSFKGEIWCIIGDFERENPMLKFLDRLPNDEAIFQFIDRFTSRIVMKFDPESESLGDFFWDYVENG